MQCFFNVIVKVLNNGYIVLKKGNSSVFWKSLYEMDIIYFLIGIGIFLFSNVFFGN